MNIKALKIGDTLIRHGLFLAPMAGMTDSAFRHIARRAGAEYCVSEMISSLAMCYGDKKTAGLSMISSDDTPIALQLFGHDPNSMAKAAYMLATGKFNGAKYEAPPSAIDINMGCPVKKIVSSGDGSALMKNPPLAAEIVRAVKKALDPIGMPVTVKIRAGWDAAHINAPEFAGMLADAGADAIYVHARTREQMYAPPADLSIISRVRDAVPPSVPVIGNGDICSYEDADKMMDETGCDGIMIGRAALGNPWIFGEIAAKADGLVYEEPPFSAKIAASLEMIRLMIAENGETVAIREARTRAAYLIRGIRGAAAIRDELNHAATYEEFASILNKIPENEQ